jgi:Family of unknown function (DUF6188)
VVVVDGDFDFVAFVGETLAEIWFWGSSLRLRLWTDGAEWRIDIADLDLDVGAGPVRLSPQSAPAELAQLLVLRGAGIERCVARKSGLLEFELTGGRHLTALPDDNYEAWEIHGPVSIVCTPGGELAVWDNDPRTSFRFSDLAEDA